MLLTIEENNLWKARLLQIQKIFVMPRELI